MRGKGEKSMLIYMVFVKAILRGGKPHLMQGCMEEWVNIAARYTILTTAGVRYNIGPR